MVVYVLNKHDKALMPCSPRTARLLIKKNKAIVVNKRPFTIKLLYGSSGYTQEMCLGVDTGEQHIGIGITQGNKTLMKTDIELRKSMEKKVLLNTRQEYRRGRRYRKVRYRRSKFKHKTGRRYMYNPKKNKMMWVKINTTFATSRPEGWLPPSIQSKVDHHIQWINKFLAVLPDNTKLTIEVAKFDIQHMQNPEIRGELYQLGRMYGYENVKSYVLAKFNYKCPICGHKFDKDHKPRMHHLTMRKYGATDNPDEFAPVCEKCHTGENHLDGAVLDKLRRATKRKEYREPTFMNILRVRLFKAFPNATFTYGNITSADRQFLGLPKTHENDAVAIAMHDCITNGLVSKTTLIDTDEVVYVKQVRKKKRSLHESNPRKGRKEPNRLAKRNDKNTKQVKSKGKTYHLYDKVKVDGQTGFITGFSGSSAYVQNFDDEYITKAGKAYKQIPLSELRVVSHSNNWICKIANAS